MESPIYITRSGQRYGPYTQIQCQQMLQAGHLVSSDIAWRQGMQEWRPVGEVVPNTFHLPPVSFSPMPARPVAAIIPEKEETAAEILGQMGCGCVLWIGLLVLAVGGGVIFPVLLILLPIALIGGVYDMVKKLIKLSKRKDQNRQN